MIKNLNKPVDWKDENHGRAWWIVECKPGTGNVLTSKVFGTKEDAERVFTALLLVSLG